MGACKVVSICFLSLLGSSSTSLVVSTCQTIPQSSGVTGVSGNNMQMWPHDVIPSFPSLSDAGCSKTQAWSVGMHNQNADHMHLSWSCTTTDDETAAVCSRLCTVLTQCKAYETYRENGRCMFFDSYTGTHASPNLQTYKGGLYSAGLSCDTYSCSIGSGASCKTCKSVYQRTASDHCETCNDGYYIVSGSVGQHCAPYSCSTGSATCCKTCRTQAQLTGNNQCATCNDGYTIAGSTCQGYSCSIGSGSSCKTCRPQTQRTDDNQCATCNDGYTVVGTTCQGYSCSTGSGSSCKTCRPQTQRTDDNQCATCNDGYTIDGGTCRGWSCSIGSGSSCKTCRTQAQLTGNNQCATCNDGYTIVGTTCQVYSCSTGRGSSCKSCVPEVYRTADNHCASCNSGHVLSGKICQPCGAGNCTSVTTTTSTVVRQMLLGNLTMTVASGKGSAFVAETNVENMFTQAISQWFPTVPTGWISDVRVELRTRRLLRLVDARTFHPEGRWLQTSLQGDFVDVSWTIEVPSNSSDIVVTILVDDFNSKSVAEATRTVNALIVSGYLGDTYDVNVTWIFATNPNPAPSPASSTSSSQDERFNYVLVVIIAGIFLICMALFLYTLYQFREMLRARKEHALQARDSFMGMDANADFLEIAGPYGTCSVFDLLKPPDEILAQDGRNLRKLARAVHLKQSNGAKVGVIYAVGQRAQDTGGYGVGTCFAAAMIKFLFDNNLPCISELMFPEGDDSRTLYLDALVSCRVVFVLQTDALYVCKQSLNEIFAAQNNHIKLLPLRFESSMPAEKLPWPQVTRMDMDDTIKVAVVQERFCKLNSMPSPPYTVPQQPDILQHLLVDLQVMLGVKTHVQTGNNNILLAARCISNEPNPVLVGKITDTYTEVSTADTITPESTLGKAKVSKVSFSILEKIESLRAGADKAQGKTKQEYSATLREDRSPPSDSRKRVNRGRTESREKQSGGTESREKPSSGTESRLKTSNGSESREKPSSGKIKSNSTGKKSKDSTKSKDSSQPQTEAKKQNLATKPGERKAKSMVVMRQRVQSAEVLARQKSGQGRMQNQVSKLETIVAKLSGGCSRAKDDDPSKRLSQESQEALLPTKTSRSKKDVADSKTTSNSSPSLVSEKKTQKSRLGDPTRLEKRGKTAPIREGSSHSDVAAVVKGQSSRTNGSSARTPRKNVEPKAPSTPV